MSLKVYHVHGIRHQAVVFAQSPQEAVAQAIERGLVGDWEAPDAVADPRSSVEQSLRPSGLARDAYHQMLGKL